MALFLLSSCLTTPSLHAWHAGWTQLLTGAERSSSIFSGSCIPGWPLSRSPYALGNLSGNLNYGENTGLTSTLTAPTTPQPGQHGDHSDLISAPSVYIFGLVTDILGTSSAYCSDYPRVLKKLQKEKSTQRMYL